MCFSWFRNVSLCLLLRLYVSICLSVSFFVPLTPLSLFLLQPIAFFIVSTCVSLDLFAVACVFFKLKSPRPGDLCVDPSKPMVRSMAHRSYSNLDVRIKFIARGENLCFFRYRNKGRNLTLILGGRLASLSYLVFACKIRNRFKSAVQYCAIVLYSRSRIRGQNPTPNQGGKISLLSCSECESTATISKL